MTILLFILLSITPWSHMAMSDRGAEVEPIQDAPALHGDSIRGHTIRWTWADGPTAGVTHEHEFRMDGTVSWRVLTGPQKGHSAEEKAYAIFRVSDHIYAISYRAESGYTLTVVLNFSTKDMYGFASGKGQWFPGRGTFEVVEG